MQQMKLGHFFLGLLPLNTAFFGVGNIMIPGSRPTGCMDGSSEPKGVPDPGPNATGPTPKK